MSERIYINNNWKFTEHYSRELLGADYKEEQLEDVRLPHTCKEVPFHYFDEKIYQMVSGYRRKIYAPKSWQGKRVILTIDGAAHESEVFFNGKKIGAHHCGYTAWSMELTGKLRLGEENILVVKVDSRESSNIPPFGHVIDYMTYGGIYRDVYLDVKEQNYLQDIFIHSKVKTGEKPKVRVFTEIRWREDARDCRMRQYIRRKGTETYQKVWEGEIKGKKSETSFSMRKPELWDTEHPALYEIKTELVQGERVLDEKVVAYGFRKAEFRADGFYLNNRKVKLRGLNRHQSYPYVGYAMPRSMQELDADILKKELGLNAVRTSHYPQSHYFLDRCDELGLLVFTEIPGWQHIGDQAWKDQAVKNVRDMVLQYRNHTSIILWGVRINESQDDDAFYQRTNDMAHKLDPYRPTGGVRFIKKSSLLEDVYTYNDFSHDGKTPGCEKKSRVTPDQKKAYLISEYNGHMYPTKAYDCEEHQTSVMK